MCRWLTSIVKGAFLASEAIQGRVDDRRGAVHVGLVSHLGCHLKRQQRPYRLAAPLMTKYGKTRT